MPGANIMPAPAEPRLSAASSNRRKSYRAELEDYPVDEPSQMHPFASSLSDNIGNGVAQISEIAPFRAFGDYTSQPTPREDSVTGTSFPNRQLRRKPNFARPASMDVPARAAQGANHRASMIPEPMSDARIPVRSSSLASHRNTLYARGYGAVSSIEQTARGSSISGHREVASVYAHRQSLNTAPDQDDDDEDTPSTDARPKSRFSKSKALLKRVFPSPKSARKMLRGSTERYFKRKQPK